MSTQNDLAVLAPQTVTWKIGDRTFEQAPLPLERLADVLDAVVEELLRSGNLSVLEKMLDEGKESLDKTDTLRVGLKVAASLPRSLPAVAAAILEADVEYMRANISMRQAVAVLRTFVQQNDIGSLVQDFFDLFKEVQGSQPTSTENGSTSD